MLDYQFAENSFELPIRLDSAPKLKSVKVPTHRGVCEVEFASLFWMNAWQISPSAAGSRVAVIGYTFADKKTDCKGTHISRAEFVFIGDQTYAIRSVPE